MRILIDKNVLISAILNPKGTPFQAYLKAVSFPNHLANVGCLIDQTSYMNRKPSTVDIICFFTEQIKHLGIDHTDQEVKGRICT